MAGTGTPGGLLVEWRQQAGRGIARPRRHRAAFFPARVAVFRNGIDESPLRMHRKKRRVLRLRCEFRRTELAGRGVEFAGVDALARAAGVSTDEDRHGLRAGLGGGGGGEEEAREQAGGGAAARVAFRHASANSKQVAWRKP